jgi:hypothetical protein
MVTRVHRGRFSHEFPRDPISRLLRQDEKFTVGFSGASFLSWRKQDEPYPLPQGYHLWR